MKQKPNFLSYLALGAGAAALALRLWLLLSIDHKGLIPANHPAGIIGYVLLGAVLVSLLVICRPWKKKPVAKWSFRKSPAAAAGCFAAAAGIVVTAVQELGQTSPITIAACVLAAAAAFCLVVLGLRRLKGHAPHPALHCVLTAYLTCHLLAQYQLWNTDPQLQNYLPQLLASIFCMMSAYHRAALDTEPGHPGTFLFFNYGAVFLSCLAIAGAAPVFYLAMALWAVSAGCPAKVKNADAMELPEAVSQCLEQLEKAGYTAYVVGGCVRDHLLGLTPHDYDMCTSATPEDICQVFSEYELVKNGEKHGTIGVVMDSTLYEITTYRTEGEYTDHRHPEQVSFITDIKQDLARRDFTINAMAWSPIHGYCDPFQGRKDLKDGILRAVGDPETRFREDALRILRGVRFAARFRLTPTEQTRDAMFACAPLMDALAKERILSELTALLPHVTAEDLITWQPILVQVIPELADTVDFQQHSPHHIYDIYTHTAHAVAALPAEFPLRFAALLHDIGKPQVFTLDENGVGHFYGHAKVSAQLARQILERLKVPKLIQGHILFLIEQHMTLPQADIKLLRKWLGKYGYDGFQDLMALQKADLIATGTMRDAELPLYDEIDRLIRQIRQEKSCLTVKDLAVNGNDLLQLGIPAGPNIGACLEYLLELVQDEAVPNQRDALLEEVKNIPDGILD